MILLGSGDPPGRLIALFGAGLIGTAIAEELAGRKFSRIREASVPWDDAPAFAPRLAEIEREISDAAGGRRSVGERSPDVRLTVIWSAGNAGFDATREQASAELERFAEIVALTDRLRRRFPARPVALALIGSAGGLFEGQRLVGPASLPAPRRPYGRLKLDEEETLLAAPPGIEPVIFRLASVYGPLAGAHRRGLIPTLIANAFEGRVTRISGTANTLRDFVWVRDAARFVVSRLLGDPGIARESVVTLASCRPASILEIRKLVEDTLGRRLYVSFAPGQTNREDITFRTATMPPGWSPSPLKTNVGLIARARLAAGGPAASPSASA